MQKLISRRTLVNYALVAGACLPALHIGSNAAAEPGAVEQNGLLRQPFEPTIGADR